MTNLTDPTKRRMHERVTTTLPVHTEQGEGQTRNLSVSGVYFELMDQTTLKDEMVFELELQLGRERLFLKCQGQVVRVETEGEKTGLGVRIIDSQLFMQSKAAS